MWNLFVYKKNKEKKGNMTDMTLGNLSYFQIEKKRKRNTCFCFSFQKNTFPCKIKLRAK